MRRPLLLLPVLLLAALTGWAHAYHATIMDVRYNPARQQLEVALKVFTDDFEQALSEQALSAGQPTASASTSRRARS